MRIAAALAVVAALVLVWPTAALSAPTDRVEARAHFQKGNAAYALGDYATAAQEYERAFQLIPDPALLYNAAQAHRVAGNKQRALLLYTNYLRVYGAQVKNSDEVQRHIDTLRKAIESDEKAQTSPPVGPLGGKEPPPTTAPTPAPPPTTGTVESPPAAAPALVVTAPPPPRDDCPLIKKPWFWVVTGGAVLVVAGLAIGLGVGLSGDKNPSPSLGAVAGN